MFKFTKKQRHWLDFLLAMTEKEIKARYKFAVLGFLWIVLNPVLQMLVIGLIFQFFVKMPGENYFLFLLAGLLPWNFFSYTVSKTTPMVVYERGLIQKAKFPRESIILSIVFSNFFHLLIALALFILVLLLLGKISFLMFLTIPLLIWLLMLTSGVSLFLSALNVRYRDVNFFVQALLPLWFYATPVVYAANLLPARFQVLLHINPMTSIIELFQLVYLGAGSIELTSVVGSISISLVIFYFGYFFFMNESKYFDDWI